MMDDIEQAIDEELMKLNLHPSQNDSESDDDNFTVLDENVSGFLFIWYSFLKHLLILNSVYFSTLYFSPLYYKKLCLYSK